VRDYLVGLVTRGTGPALGTPAAGIRPRGFQKSGDEVLANRSMVETETTPSARIGGDADPVALPVAARMDPPAASAEARVRSPGPEGETPRREPKPAAVDGQPPKPRVPARGARGALIPASEVAQAERVAAAGQATMARSARALMAGDRDPASEAARPSRIPTVRPDEASAARFGSRGGSLGPQSEPNGVATIHTIIEPRADLTADLPSIQQVPAAPVPSPRIEVHIGRLELTPDSGPRPSPRRTASARNPGSVSGLALARRYLDRAWR